MAVPAPLAGIAALAAAAPRLDPHRQVEFFDLEARSILTRCASDRVPFAWTLNPYRGCEFGCQYCYARYAHEFMELRGADDFERKIFVKRRAAELLRVDLARVKTGEAIAIGTATDPYQPAERQFQVMRALLEVLAGERGLDLGLVTKSTLVARDAELLARVARRNRLVIRITITTTDAALARILEPRAPRPDLRLRAVARLRAAGLTAGVICAPVLPGINDQAAALEALAAAAARAGASFFHANALFLPAAAQAHFFPFLAARFPQLAADYRRRFAHARYQPRWAQNQVSEMAARLAARHGLPSRAPAAPPPAQLNLF
ncbi:MAG: radical SAM protein [Terriglobales bacterium]